MSIPVRLKMTFAAMTVIGVSACGYTSPTMPSVTTVNDAIGAGAFTPASIDITVGSTVTWTNQDNAAHTVVADKGAFNSGAIAPGATFSYMFPTAGTVTYHDSAHPGMTGTVNVTGSPMPSPY